MKAELQLELFSSLNLQEQLDFLAYWMEQVHGLLPGEFRDQALVEEVISQIRQWNAIPKVPESRNLDLAEMAALLSYSLNEDFMEDFLARSASRGLPASLETEAWTFLLAAFALIIQKIHALECHYNPLVPPTLDEVTNDISLNEVARHFAAFQKLNSDPETALPALNEKLSWLAQQPPLSGEIQ